MSNDGKDVVSEAETIKSEAVIQESPNSTPPELSPVALKRKEQLDELFSLMNNAAGYLVTVTTLSNGKLNHHLVTQSFPEIDILKSIGAAEKLAVERLRAL